MLVFAALVLLGALPAYWLGSFLGVVLYGALWCFFQNCWMRVFMMAGPRTSRQVPPSPIAYCQQLSAQELSRAYQSGSLNCTDVVRIYINHIKRVNPYVCAMVFECFDEAMVAAEQADRVWAQWRSDRTKPMPSWLLGVPCTIKESMECRGCPNTSGHPHRRAIISAFDSPVVHNFRAAGAIILGVTNTSELCMWYESSNHLYGITCNPFDTRCIVGGSSGGEGVAASCSFSTFGLGSDIGGSIRMPAFFNGVYGHKSSPHYVSNKGQHPGAKTSANHYLTTGPISRFVEDLIPLTEVAARGGFGLDPVIFPPARPLRRATDLHQLKGRLCVYVLEDFGAPWPVRVSQSQRDAVRVAANALREHYGAKVCYVNLLHPKRCTGGAVPPEFKPFSNIMRMWFNALTKDSTEHKFHILMTEGYHSPHNWFAELGRWVLGQSEHTLPAIMLSVIERLELIMPRWLTNWIFLRNNYMELFKKNLEALLGDNGVIITPTYPTTAPRHHFPLWNPFQFQYTAAFNVLQLPSTACPVWPDAETQGRHRANTYFEARADHKSADYHLPKGIQVVGATHQDELCISVALALERTIGGFRYPGWARLEKIDY